MYICPVCRKKLYFSDKSWVCAEHHSFDVHRKGYVNLMTTRKLNPKRAGDNSDMVRARTQFLDYGHYLPLAEKTADIMERLTPAEHPTIVDSGCGEGYYTVNYARLMPNAQLYGIDISKAACSHAMSRVNEAAIDNAHIAVASSFELPFDDETADLVVCTFAPVSDREYARVLKKGGHLVVVSPSAEHLFELKALIYDEPYKNKPNDYGLESFTEGEEIIYEYKAMLSTRDEILSLYKMTPYFYKTSAPDAAKLIETESLEVTCGFSIRVFAKK
ncbi:MAG: methyltransferase domain-containing protein [Ruminococcus sp.]|nr:methyltransferase domain-containing protein [Ruminococcus sp.]